MSRILFHPEPEQIELPRVLECLSDPVRLAIAVMLSDAEKQAQELRCRDLSPLGGKTNLTYHLDKMREAGLIRTVLVGTSRYMKLRRQDLEGRFPNLLLAILQAAPQQGGKAGGTEIESPKDVRLSTRRQGPPSAKPRTKTPQQRRLSS